MRLTDILKPSLISIGVVSRTKPELFSEMLQLFVSARLLKEPGPALQSLLEREAKMSTGLSRGLALPHGKVKGIRGGLLLALGTCPEGMPYESLDSQPARVVFLALAEEGNPGPHLEALAEISRLFSIDGFAAQLAAAPTGADALRIIRHEE